MTRTPPLQDEHVQVTYDVSYGKFARGTIVKPDKSLNPFGLFEAVRRLGHIESVDCFEAFVSDTLDTQSYLKITFETGRVSICHQLKDDCIVGNGRDGIYARVWWDVQGVHIVESRYVQMPDVGMEAIDVELDSGNDDGVPVGFRDLYPRSLGSQLGYPSDPEDFASTDVVEEATPGPQVVAGPPPPTPKFNRKKNPRGRVSLAEYIGRDTAVAAALDRESAVARLGRALDRIYLAHEEHNRREGVDLRQRY